MQIPKSLKDPTLTELLMNGAVGVMPTDTVYGLVCRAVDETAVSKLYALKSRENKPGTVIASSPSQLEGLGLKTRYIKALDSYWRDGLSIIIPTGFDLKYLHLGKMSLACRVQRQNKDLNELLNKTGALLTTSANLPGKPPANNILEAEKYFGDKVDFYVEGGDLSGKQPSTLIRIVDDAVEVLREGAVKIDEETGRIL